MPRYRFNVRHDERVFLDPESQVLPGIEEAEAEALHALAEMAKDAIPATLNRELAVEVADETGRPLLIAKIILRITRDAVLVSTATLLLAGCNVSTPAAPAGSTTVVPVPVPTPGPQGAPGAPAPEAGPPGAPGAPGAPAP